MSTSRLWFAYALSAVAVMFFLMDGGMKVARAQPSVVATTALGFPDSSVRLVGAILLLLTLLYLVPATAAIGAVLLTGFLGGAVAAQLRMEAPLWSHILFPVYVAGFLWGGLLLRRPDLMAVVLGRATRSTP